MDAKTTRIVAGILEFLGEEYNLASTSTDAKESLEVAMQCLETAFCMGGQERQQPPGHKTLRQLYDEASGVRGSGDMPAGETMYLGIDIGPEYTLPAEATEEQKAQAEEFKTRGNDAMKSSNYSDAMGNYNRAVELDGRNSVYFCNRAAAAMKLEQFDQSLRDCQIAIRLQPKYARAYGRMGVTYSSRNMHIEAIMCYKKALILEPNNESYMTNLRYSQSMIAQQATQTEAAAAEPNNPMGGLESMMRNPNLVNMASQMLRDPAMNNMIQNLMGGLMNPNSAAAPQQQQQQQTEAAAPPQMPGLQDLMMMGQQIANTIRANNPQLADELNLNIGNPPNSRNPDNHDNAPES